MTRRASAPPTEALRCGATLTKGAGLRTHPGGKGLPTSSHHDASSPGFPAAYGCQESPGGPQGSPNWWDIENPKFDFQTHP